MQTSELPSVSSHMYTQLGVIYAGAFALSLRWVMAALDGAKTDFGKHGDADFETVNDEATRRECIKKGTAYMSGAVSLALRV